MNTSKKRTFSKSIINKFHKLVEVPATIQAKVSLLEDMEEIFDDDIFCNPFINSIRNSIQTGRRSSTSNEISVRHMGNYDS